MNFLLNNNSHLKASIIHDIFSLGYMFFIILTDLFNIKSNEFHLDKRQNGYTHKHFNKDIIDLKRKIKSICMLSTNKIKELVELLSKMIYPDRAKRFQNLDDLIDQINLIYITI